MTDLLFLHQSMGTTLLMNRGFLSFLVPGGAELRRDPKALLHSLSVIAGHAVLLFMSLMLKSFYKYSELAPC